MTEAEREEARLLRQYFREEARLLRQYFRDEAIKAIDNALTFIDNMGLEAAVWDLQAARRRIEEAREKTDDQA